MNLFRRQRKAEVLLCQLAYFRVYLYRFGFETSQEAGRLLLVR